MVFFHTGSSCFVKYGFYTDTIVAKTAWFYKHFPIRASGMTAPTGPNKNFSCGLRAIAIIGSVSRKPLQFFRNAV
jgi:hypothetical protein